jgi:hypothetical protein
MALTFTTIDRTEHTTMWQVILFTAGAAGLAAAIVLEIALLVHHTTSTVLRTGTSTVTNAGPAGPSQSLVTTCLIVGVAFVLASAFFSRISKLVLPGGFALDLNTGAKLAGAIAAKTSQPDVAERLYKQAAPKAAQLMSTELMSATQPGPAATAPLDDATVARIVDEAE